MRTSGGNMVVDWATEATKGLVAFISGGLAGSVMTQYFTSQRHKTDITLKLMDGFFSQYQALAETKYLLQSNRPLTADELNHVRKIGDWLELAALLYLRRSTDNNLIKSFGMPDEMKAFFRLAQTNVQLQDVIKLWTNLHNVFVERL
jgi:hypothetical protein